MTGKDEALLRAGYEPCTSAEVAGLLTPKLAMKEEEYVRILHMSYRSWRDLRVDLREKLRERMAGGVRAKKYIEDPKGMFLFLAFCRKALTIVGNVARSRGNRMRYR